MISKDIFIAFQKGDIVAYEKIFKAYYNRVRGFVLSIIKSDSYSKDITHNVFLILWERRNQLQAIKTFDSYLFTIARNEAYQFLRKQQIHNRYVEHVEYNYSESAPEVFGIIESEELMLLIRSILSKLPEQKREIFLLSREEGLTNDEIASKFNISSKTVANNISEVLRIIRDVID